MNDKGIYVGAVAVFNMPPKKVQGQLRQCLKCGYQLGSLYCPNCGTETQYQTRTVTTTLNDFIPTGSRFDEMLYQLPVADANERGVRYYVGNQSNSGQVNTDIPTTISNTEAYVNAFCDKYADMLCFLSTYHGITGNVCFMVVPWYEY